MCVCVPISVWLCVLQPQLVSKYGYPVESHTVLTADGYFLALHRIPRGRLNATRHKGVVIVQHGILSSSADWVILGPDKALGRRKLRCNSNTVYCHLMFEAETEFILLEYLSPRAPISQNFRGCSGFHYKFSRQTISKD